MNLTNNVLLSTVKFWIQELLAYAQERISGITVSILETKVGREVTISDSQSSQCKIRPRKLIEDEVEVDAYILDLRPK